MVQGELDVDTQLVQGNTKAAMKAAGASSRDLWQVEFGQLRIIPGFNTRIKNAAYFAHVRNIADSIKAEGYYQDKPMAGFVAKENGQDVIFVTDGHCRYDAVELAISEGAEIVRIPVVVAHQGTSMEDLTVALVRANSGKPLEPYEIGMVCKRLTRYNWEIETIAQRLGFSEKYVEGLLLLMGSQIEIRNMVQNDEVAASTAIEAIRKYGEKAYSKLKQALDAAKASGGEKATKKYLPEQIFKKRVAKAAPSMFNAISEIQADPGYDHISPELREKLEALLKELNSDDLVSEGQGSHEG